MRDGEPPSRGPSWSCGPGGNDPCVESAAVLGLPPLSAADIAAALNRSDTRVCYQPIVRVADRKLVGLEALARLHREGFGVLAPNRFIPQAEAAGMGWPLTLAVADVVVHDWVADELSGLGVTVSLNVPLDVMLSEGPMDALNSRLRDAGLPASSVVLELTETRPLVRLPELAAAVERLRRRGYGVAIDDVGPDGRDCAPLLALPFTELKLDRPLVEASAACPRAAAAIANTVSMAHGSGMRVVAEGVADRPAWDRMAGFGVDDIQGFLVARPMPAAAVRMWRADWSDGGGAATPVH